jgi:hypothetical protein
MNLPWSPKALVSPAEPVPARALPVAQSEVFGTGCCNPARALFSRFRSGIGQTVFSGGAIFGHAEDKT